MSTQQLANSSNQPRKITESHRCNTAREMQPQHSKNLAGVHVPVYDRVGVQILQCMGQLLSPSLDQPKSNRSIGLDITVKRCV